MINLRSDGEIAHCGTPVHCDVSGLQSVIPDGIRDAVHPPQEPGAAGITLSRALRTSSGYGERWL